MKLKTKKLLLTTGVLASAATTLFSVACGQSSRRYDTEFDKTVNVHVPWSGNQLFGMGELARVFNQLHKNDADFLEVKVKNDGGASYATAHTQLTNEINVKSKTTLPNIIINYGGTLATIADYNMEIPLDAKTLFDKENKYAIDKESFEADFLTFNDRVGGIAKGTLHAIPLTKSTELIAVNSPVMSYIFESMVSLGAKVDETDAEFKKWYDGILSKGKADRSYIEKEWGSVRTNEEKSKYENGKYIIKKSVFQNTTELLDFAKKAQALFTNTNNNVVGNKHIITLSGPYNSVATNLFSMTAKKKDDFSNSLTPLKEDGYVDYSKSVTEGTETFKGLTKITQEFYEASKTGGLHVSPSFPSILLTSHQTAMAISSSAGYSFNFIAKNDKSDILRLKFDKDLKAASVELRNVAELGLPQGDSVLPASFLKWKQDSADKLHKSDSTEKQGKFDLKLENSEADKTFENFIKQFKEETNKQKKPLLIYKEPKVDEFYEKNKELAKSAGLEFLGKVSHKNKDKVETSNLYGVVDRTASNVFSAKHNGANIFDYIPFNNESRLQEEELEVLPAPIKWEPNNKISSVYLQGPSMMAVHNNEKEDIATVKFIKWLTTKEKYAFQYKKDTYKNASNLDTTEVNEARKETPLEYLGNVASYIIPFKGAFSGTPSENTNIFIKTALGLFKKVTEDSNWSFVEEPADVLTNQFRSSFGTAFSTPLKLIQENKPDSVSNYKNDVVKRIKELFTA